MSLPQLKSMSTIRREGSLRAAAQSSGLASLRTRRRVDSMSPVIDRASHAPKSVFNPGATVFEPIQSKVEHLGGIQLGPFSPVTMEPMCNDADKLRHHLLGSGGSTALTEGNEMSLSDEPHNSSEDQFDVDIEEHDAYEHDTKHDNLETVYYEHGHKQWINQALGDAAMSAELAMYVDNNYYDQADEVHEGIYQLARDNTALYTNPYQQEQASIDDEDFNKTLQFGASDSFPTLLYAQEPLVVVPSAPRAFSSPPNAVPKSAFTHGSGHTVFTTVNTGRFHAKSAFNHRNKRTDQGPEPSSADIYPEDALIDYMPKRRSSMHSSRNGDRRYSAARQIPATSLLEAPVKIPVDLYVNRVEHWPTPAEALETEHDVGQTNANNTQELGHQVGQAGHDIEHTNTLIERKPQDQVYQSEPYIGQTSTIHEQELISQTAQKECVIEHNEVHKSVKTSSPLQEFVRTSSPGNGSVHSASSLKKLLVDSIADVTLAPVRPVFGVSLWQAKATILRANTPKSQVGTPVYHYSGKSDSIPMTLDQLDGSKYGLHLGGLGLGKDWQPPVVYKTHSFKKPFQHSGWCRTKWT